MSGKREAGESATRPPTIDQVLDRSNLRAAWREVEANRGGPGLDDVTLGRWARNWEANLERLRQQVRTNTYHPTRPRRVRVLKKDGTCREICILTVTDRVLQRAVLNVLEEVFEKRFLNCSFGYRPRRSVANAVTAVVRNRERGLRWVLDADIDDCFDSLDHALIMQLIEPHLPDTRIRNLIAAWLRVGQLPARCRNKLAPLRRSEPVRADRPGKGSPVGVPQGGVISPLLCNLVLHEMDCALTRAGWNLVRYADDFVVLTHSEAAAHQAWSETQAALAGLHLKLNLAKTRVASFEEGFHFLGVEFRGDTYSYVHRSKRITGKGPTVRLLYQYRPEFY